MIVESVKSPVNEGNKIIHSVGMIVALVSFAMLFLTLLMGLAIYRFTTPVWPPQGMIRPSLILPICSTVTIFLSSVTYIWFEKDIFKNKAGLVATLALGLAFMCFQFIFWNSLKEMGMVPSSGIFASLIYAFTWIHAAHIVLALILVSWLLIGFNSINVEKLTIRSMNVGKFWHFLGIVWFIIFMTIFVF